MWKPCVSRVVVIRTPILLDHKLLQVTEAEDLCRLAAVAVSKVLVVQVVTSEVPAVRQLVVQQVLRARVAQEVPVPMAQAEQLERMVLVEQTEQ
jgi:hypothetical protein